MLMRYVGLLVLFFLFLGVGCANQDEQKTEQASSATTQQETQEVVQQTQEEIETEDLPVFDLISSQTTILAQLESSGRGGRFKEGLANILSDRSVLLLDGACNAQTYIDLAKTVYRQKDIGSYHIVIATFAEGALSTTDSCIKMFFPMTDIESLKSMLALLQSDFQNKLEETEVSLTIQQDLPGPCEEVAAYVAKRFPKSAERAYERCKRIRQQEQE